MEELNERYGYKLKSLDEVCEIIGPRPRVKSVIMCHGVFDIVHPGHLRHLMYAKNKADLLLVSLTRDAHIEKGRFRPHVPEKLRALNVAAFEAVDFVLIDENETPLKNITSIQPDFFAKGYEYVDSDNQPKTLSEKTLVESYGGEMIFTPSDLIYSSSKLINSAAPPLKYEKLAIVLETENVKIRDLRDTLETLGRRKVHVLGDTIVDSFTQTSLVGGQTKTPTISVRYENRIDHIGGAAIVAQHLRATGANVSFSTVLGNDELKNFVVKTLELSDIKVNAHIDANRPTTNKNIIIAGGYRLLKVDTVDNTPISEQILSGLALNIENTEADAIVFSDFRHGIFNKQSINRLVKHIPSGVFRVADSQVASRWGNIIEFQNFDLITPNEREARFSLSDQDSHLRALASNLYDTAGCKTLMLTLGERGVLTCRDPNHLAIGAAIFIDSFSENALDPVGAGDALLAYSTLSLLATANPTIATIIGSFAAAVACEREGNIPVKPNEVMSKIDQAEEAIRFG
ncbi:MAG: ADP-heptose synthase [Rhodospirillaceae bacterium]|nr:ADP-heptose synthase [Rhodospirillaceae bacterium]|tara:strand:+ start:4836 stop:6383 length:1548 start_codon:yes stop_codon:yes gene_type:complete